MSNNYLAFMYFNIDSKVHKMNSKIKILWFLLSLIISIISIDYVSVLLFYIFIFIIMFKTNVKFDYYIYSILLIWPVYIMIFIFAYLFSFNILFTILMLLKFMLIVILFVILTATTSLSEIAWGFECLFQKLKKTGIPVSKIALKIAMLIKFISTLFNQNKQIRKSMAYRGISLNENKITVFFKMIIPTISLSYKLSNRTVSAMKLRFYGSSKKRTNYHDNKVTRFDKVLIFLNLVFMYISIAFGWFL